MAPSPWARLADLSLEEGDLTKAEEHARRALSLTPDGIVANSVMYRVEEARGDPRAQLARMRRDQGRPDEARADLRRFLERPKPRMVPSVPDVIRERRASTRPGPRSQGDRS